MSHLDAVTTGRTVPATGQPVTPTTSPLVKAVTLLAIGCLLGFIGIQGQILIAEWSELRRDVRENRTNLLIGYENISPKPTYAAHPANWYHHEGSQTFLWSGWKSGSHQWFRIGRDEIAKDQLSIPFGRDSIQAIDSPLVEVGDGLRWRRIPDDASVAGIEIDGDAVVYPLKVLEKVEVINDLLGGMPLVVTFAPFSIEREAVAIYEAAIEGRRLSLGVSGYFLGRQPLLYDRETESLWAGSDAGLAAVAGPRKGLILKTVGRPVPVAWSEWRSKYPRSRLVVGADRPGKADPALSLARARSKSSTQPAP